METQHGRSLYPDFINPAGLYDPAPNGYSHVARAPEGSALVLIAGQGGEDASGALADGFRAQVRQALDNLRVAARAVGGDLDGVLKQTVLVVGHSEARLRVIGEEFERAYGAGPKPACTLIPVPRLALDGMLFEVEAILAVRG